jgi:DNA-binding PadR family transcriptional regulator
MRRSLDYCWPKAESVLYDEPKRLVRQGLASARSEPNGRRTRTVYEITRPGRDALNAWLSTRPDPPRFEFEPLLRLIFADQGSKQDLLQAVHVVRDWAGEQLAAGRLQCVDYLQTGGPFPERLHLIALFAGLYADLLDVLDRWSDRAEHEIRSWPRTNDVGLTDGARHMLENVLILRPGPDQSAGRNDTERRQQR